MIKTLFTNLFKAILLFKKRKGLVISAASAFYILVTIIPLSLLLMRILGHLIGNIRSVEDAFFNLGNELFPIIATQVFEALRGAFMGPLFASAKFTWINLVIFLWFSLALLNSIWGGLFLLTGDRSTLSITKHLKGMFIISLTIIGMLIIMALPTVAHFGMEYLRNSVVIAFVGKYFPQLGLFLEQVFTIGPFLKFILRSTVLHVIIFFIYFTLLYKWFFSNRISYGIAALGALIFTILLTIGRSIFLAYFIYIRGAVIENYGDYYTSIIAIIWIFLMMCFFFYGACLCYVSHKKESYLEKQFYLYWRKRIDRSKDFFNNLKLYSDHFRSKMRSLMRK